MTGDDDAQALLELHLRAETLGRGLRQVRSDGSDPRGVQARRTGAVLRQIIDRFTATSAPTEVLAEAAALLDEVEALLAGYPSVRRTGQEPERSHLGHDRAFFEWSPQLGLSSPLAPPMVLDVEGDAVVARATFGIAYEGPPGCVHGGFIAAAFDELLGVTQTLSGQVGMTGTLRIKYRRPTPLNTELRFVGRVTGLSGRKIVTVAHLYSGEDLTAEAEGLFVTVPPEKFAELAPFRLG